MRFTHNRSTRAAPAYPPWQSAYSEDAMRRAWTAVRANRGTAGADGATMAEFEKRLDANLSALRRDLLDGSYRPQRVTQVLVPKAGDKWRPISLWTIRDRVAQRAAYNYLEGPFDLAVDVGCMHSFSDEERDRHIQELARLLAPGATYMLFAHLKDENDDNPPGRNRPTPALLQTLLAPWFTLERQELGTTQVEDKPPWLSGWFWWKRK